MALPVLLPAYPPPRSWLAGVRALLLTGITALGGIAAVSTPAQADSPQMRRGAWIVEGEYTGVVPSRCIAMNVALADHEQGAAARKAGQSFDPDTMQSILVAYVANLGAIGFVVGVQVPGGPIWQTDDAVPVSVSVDGVPIELRATTALDPTSVTIISQVPGRQPGGLLRAVEVGKRMDVEVAGQRHAFDLEQAKEAVALISQCAMNGGALPAAAIAASGTTGSGASGNAGTTRNEGGSQTSVEGPASPTAGQPIQYGSWEVAEAQSPLGTRCLAANQAQGRAYLGAYRRDGRTHIAVTMGDVNLGALSTIESQLVVDGERIALDAGEIFNNHTLLLSATGEATGGATDDDGGGDSNGNDGPIVAALRRGWQADVTIAGHRDRFRLDGTIAALDALARCEAQSEAADIALEVEGDREEAGIASGSEADGKAGAPVADTSSPPDALGQVLDTFDGTGSVPLATFHCQFTGLDLLGMAGIDERSRPTEARFAVQEDGTLLLNGATVAAAQTKMGGGEVASAIYPAREVIHAIIGTPGPLPRGDRLGFAGAQAFAQSYISQQFDTLLANRQRFMVVGVANGLVGFFELGSDGRATGQTASDCERLASVRPSSRQ